MSEFIKTVVGLLLVGVFLAPQQAQAEDVTLSWVNPTNTFTLSLAGPYTNPAGTKVYMEVGDTLDPDATSLVLPELKPGTYKFVAVSYDDRGVASPISTEAEKVVTEFTVTDIVVKIVTTTPNGFLLLGVGTIPLGTPCDADQEVNDHYAVPQDEIVWSDPARNAGTAPIPVLVVAKCG